MKLHYKGKYNLDPASLPHGEHMPGAVKFREAEDSKELGRISTWIGLVIILALAIPAYFRCRAYADITDPQIFLGVCVPLLLLFPHEILHAICFKEHVYLYTNLKQGMLFVIGPEKMSKARFIFMSLLPNIVLGMIPYLIGFIYPQYIFFTIVGISMMFGAGGDLYNVYNALTQMPKGARTYLYQFNSYWYMPE